MGKPVVKVEPFVDEQINTPKVVVDREVDIVSWTNKGDFASNKDEEDPDATDYSSSFADTVSDAENSARLSDDEVESESFADNGSACNIDTHDSAFRMRKKKLTDHWKNYIRPLMWRCKWAELKIKEIESQALKYRKELAAIDRRKQMQAGDFSFEEFGSKSLPFSNDQYRSKVIRRRNRKKVEDTTEVALYTSRHHLFSYFENKRSDADGSLDDDFDNPVITEPHADSIDRAPSVEDLSFFEYSDADASYENLVWKIDILLSRVHNAKGRMDDVMTNNASRFSSLENLNLLPHGDVQTSYAQSPATSAGIGDTSVGAMFNSTQQHVADFDFGNFIMRDSAVSIPDIFESTVGLLSATDVTLQPASAANATLQPALVGDSNEVMVDNVLMHEVAETEPPIERPREVEKAEGREEGDPPSEKPEEEVEKGEGEESLNPASIPVSDVNDVATTSCGNQEQSTLKSCINNDVNFPKNKRKRGERKAGSGGWSKTCSKEPDNQ